MVNRNNVFVTVGSTDFDSLVQAVDDLVPVLQLQGIMQIGHGRYTPVNLPYFRFAPALTPFYHQASLVIAHGGLATTMEVLSHEIPLVSVSNPDRYDDHQQDLLSALAGLGYLIWCRRLDQLKQAVEAAQSTPLRRYEQPEVRIQHVIHDFLSAPRRRKFKLFSR